MRCLLPVLFVFMLHGCADAQAQPGTRKLLFIGNSLTYSNDLPALVQEMYVALGKPKPLVESITRGGASLGDHWQVPGTRERIANVKWDYIILQQGPTSLAESQREMMKDIALAKPWLKQSGAKPALFMVWPETHRARVFPQVRQAYANAAKELDGVFLPAGLALQQIMEKDKTADLFTDNLHPTPLGTYLAALVITARLTDTDPGQLPAKIRWARHYSIQLTPEQFKTVRSAVETALKDKGN